MSSLTSSESGAGQISIVPPLKWAGGKRWFVANHLNLIPEKFNNYVEPFLGSGAVFFSITPQRSVISDINEELINLYEVIRDQPRKLKARMIYHQKQHGNRYYYKVRESQPKSSLSRAARTLYLLTRPLIISDMMQE